ncbi:MAG: hypothetical protein ABII90_00310 [Bacteroidota bacterium]
MKFKPVSIDKYVEEHLKNNPSENEKDLRTRLDSALTAYKNGERCACGNDIWVIGSATIGNSCFTCITGESPTADDYEIDVAIKKRKSTKGRRHIDDMDPTKIAGIFDDDGYEINPDLIKKPSLCVTCIYDANPIEEVLCQLTRADQEDDNEFICYEYEKM